MMSLDKPRYEQKEKIKIGCFEIKSITRDIILLNNHPL
jgi:hypothetical protein